MALADDEFDALWREQAVPIAPGVVGVLFDDPHDGALVINYIGAEHEGEGRVAAFLDGLPPQRTVRVIAVTSDRLAGMLQRRGYRKCNVLSPLGDHWFPAYVRRASTP